MIDAVFLTIGSLAILAAVIKTADSGRSGHQPGQYLLIVVFVALAMACFLLSYTAQIDADHLYPQLGRLLSNLSVLIAAFALLALQLTISYSPADAYPRIRRRFQLLVVSLLGMAVCFATAAPPPRRLGDFGILYRTRPVLLIYIAIYIAFLGTALTELLSLSWRYAQLARERRYLRLGLRLLATGSMLGLIYLAEKVTYVIAEAAALQSPLGTDYHCTSPMAPAQCRFEITLTSTAILICVIGATLPVRGPIVATPLRRRWRARTHARLEPLWAALHRAFPQIALAEDPGNHAYQHSELGFLLYRRVIEILDGRLLLRPWLDTQTEDHAFAITQRARRTSDRHRAAAEAARIAAALHAHNTGLPLVRGRVPRTASGHPVQRRYRAGQARLAASVDDGRLFRAAGTLA